jgi:hypothetical protein
MTDANRGEKEHIGIGWYILAAASFFPLIGIPFGLCSLLLGWLWRAAGGLRLAAIGAAGIGVSVVLYGSLFLAQKSGYFDDLTGELTQRMLDDAVRSVEFYKLRNGDYPDSLDAIRSENAFIYDPFSDNQAHFLYSLHNQRDSYEIFSVGPDRLPATSDDLHPSPETVRGTGYARK